MKITQIITEGATDILYHYTSIHNAALALADGNFKLSSVAGNKSEASYAPPGYNYFLSTTRSRVGDYHRWVGTGAVMFVLDGQWIGSRYPVKPIDYWERAWQHSPDRTRESEDRVFSKKNEMPITPVTAIHVLLKEKNENRSPLTRKILIDAKKQGIKTHLYTDEKAWRLQDTRRAIKAGDTGDLLRGQQRTDRFDRPIRGLAARRGGEPYGRSDILDWIELIKKKPGQPLSKTADKLRYNLQYWGDHTQRLENDLFNAKKPGDREYPLAVKLADWLSKQGIDVKQLSEFLKKKWKSQ